MTATRSIQTQSPDRRPASDARRVRNRRADPTPQPGGARILRRWSVTDLIARAGGAPRAFA